MRVHLVLIMAIIPVIAILTPLTSTASQNSVIAQTAKPTPAQVKTAVKNALMSVDLTLKQKREIKSMVENYQTQTANADDATKQAAAKTLMKNIYGTLTPDQQKQFKASIKQSLSMDVE
jgi:ABC-type transporter MlaC component